MLLADFSGRLQPLPRPRRWHSDINHDKIRRGVADQREQLDGIASLSHDLEAGAFEQARQPLAEQQLVFSQHYAHWSVALTSRGPGLGPNEPADQSIVMVSIIG